MSIDLHCHTRLSDGSADLQEVITIAKKTNLSTIAITDHDTFAGCDAAVRLGKEAGINVVPAAEISTIDRSRNKKAHILCYYPTDISALSRKLKQICDNRYSAMLNSIGKVADIFPITTEMVLRRSKGSTSIYKQHIMQTLMDLGYADEIFGTVFRELFDSKHGLAYTSVDYPDTFEIINDVHNAGGIAILAHPSEYKSMELLQELAERGLIDGAEMNHPRNTASDKLQIEQIASRYDLILTGGTDFHGYYTSKRLPIGSHTTDPEQFHALRKLKGFK